MNVRRFVTRLGRTEMMERLKGKIGKERGENYKMTNADLSPLTLTTCYLFDTSERDEERDSLRQLTPVIGSR